ncbi:ABC transporter ATP-binding protein [Domibacillus indicus]|uniref:ABC transporter ATP-binding protein n=1 Tax=Domibacillus indicus TaxID=1437523 RepID=UPI000617AB3C|nr:ABC transporter ATP-binding protein [Domibacillus indicus]
MRELLVLKNITKTYRGKPVLNDASFSLFSNQITALVGRNGSGKSTLLKIAGGIIKPDSGSIHRNEQMCNVGYVPEITPAVLPFTPVEYLMYMGKIRGMQKKELQERISDLLDIFGLQHVRNERMTGFSKGMKQKAAIMQAMLEETDMLILDEPLSGLDPGAQQEVEGLLVDLKGKGLSILLTCHETKLLEQAADRVLLIDDHRITETAGEKENEANVILFVIPSERAVDSLPSSAKIRQQTVLNTAEKQIELAVEKHDTNKTLEILLKNKASIQAVYPLRSSTDIQHYFQKRGGGV